MTANSTLVGAVALNRLGRWGQRPLPQAFSVSSVYSVVTNSLLT